MGQLVPMKTELPYEKSSYIPRLDSATSFTPSVLRDASHDDFSTSDAIPTPVHESGTLILPITKKPNSTEKIHSMRVCADEVLGGYNIRHKGVTRNFSGDDWSCAQVGFYVNRPGMIIGYWQWNGTDAWTWFSAEGDVSAVTITLNQVDRIAAQFVDDSSGATYPAFAQMTSSSYGYYAYLNNSISSNNIDIIIRDSTPAAPTTLPASTRIFVQRIIKRPAGGNAQVDSDALFTTAGLINLWVSGEGEKIY